MHISLQATHHAERCLIISGAEEHGEAAALAEFTALRAEVLQMKQIQWAILAFQLGATGVVVKLALSPHRTAWLLIVPLLSYVLVAQYLRCSDGLDRISAYIRDDLNPRVSGHLQWEEWKYRRSRSHIPQTKWIGLANWLRPLSVVFAWVPAAALMRAVPYILAQHSLSAWNRLLLTSIWLFLLAITMLTFYLTKCLHGLDSPRERDRHHLASREQPPGEGRADEASPAFVHTSRRPGAPRSTIGPLRHQLSNGEAPVYLCIGSAGHDRSHMPLRLRPSGQCLPPSVEGSSRRPWKLCTFAIRSLEKHLILWQVRQVSVPEVGVPQIELDLF
jgi:hypothetical protein